MKFTKKPVTIDAVQWNKDGDHPNVVELPKKVRDTIDERTTALGVDALRWIGTLEGGHIVCKGDWIITGVQGEQYPCKPDIFALTYDAAPIPPDEPKLKRASLMAFGVISEIRKLVGNGKVQFVADLGGSIWTWPDAADSAITELRSVCFDAAPIQPTPSQQEALDSLAGLLLGIELPQGKALAARQERACCLRDFILARPDTEGSGK